MKHLKVVLPIMVALVLGACARAPQHITLEQNKPEIDAALKAYAESWSKTSHVTVTVKSVGGSSGIDLGTQLKADFAAGDMPDIFAISGLEDYKQWSNLTLDLTGEKWINDTSVPFKSDGKVFGFPVAVEGWGLAYNADILKKAGVDPLTLNNYAAYKAAFEKIDAMKASLGLKSVVSMAASIDMSWVTRDHDLNALLSNGLPYGDMSVTNDLLAGKVDAKRLSEYADWVELMFKYADKAVLTTGNYDAQVGAFATGKAAFLHQGNWVDPNMAQAKATFAMAFAPYGSTAQPADGIFVAAPSYYVINKNSKNIPAAKKFLNDLVYTDAGNKYMVVDALHDPRLQEHHDEPRGPALQVGPGLGGGRQDLQLEPVQLHPGVPREDARRDLQPVCHRGNQQGQVH